MAKYTSLNWSAIDSLNREHTAGIRLYIEECFDIEAAMIFLSGIDSLCDTSLSTYNITYGEEIATSPPSGGSLSQYVGIVVLRDPATGNQYPISLLGLKASNVEKVGGRHVVKEDICNGVKLTFNTLSGLSCEVFTSLMSILY